MSISRPPLHAVLPTALLALAATIIGISVASTSGGEERGSLVIGIDGGHGDWSSTEINARVQLGAAVTRHEWDPLSPLEDEEDVVLAAATEIHTHIQALLGGNEIGDPIEYRDWVVEFIHYYGPSGTFWREHPGLDASRYAITTLELGNEPYLEAMSAADYADAIRPTLEAIAHLDLPVKVVIPAYVYGDDTSWIDTLYERIPGLNSLFYAFALHPYWYGHDPAEPGPAGSFARIDALRGLMDAHGAESKPIYITEYGQSTAACGDECVSEAQQAADLAAMIAAVASHSGWKVEMLSVFQLLDRGTDSNDRELQFGLLSEGGTPKPAYGIVRAAMQGYRG
jgi:Glycosyl hydrolase catalytic core